MNSTNQDITEKKQLSILKEEWIKEGQTFDHEIEYWDKHILYHEHGFRHR